MRYNKYYISVFHNLLLFNSVMLISCFYPEPKWIMNDSVLEDYITANSPQIATETTKLCSLPPKIKVAICNYIFNKTHEGKHRHLKYLNKIAFSLLSTDCVKKSVISARIGSQDFDIIIPQQYMMQCYGRYNPIRSSWIEDDVFDTVYICAGINSTSFIILAHNRTIDNFYHPFALVERLVPEKLPEVDINRNNLNEELTSLESVSRNMYYPEIEDIFIYEKFRSKLETYDSICNLKTSNKILLCEKIVNFRLRYFNVWILDKTAFNDYSSQCVERTLAILGNSKEFNEYNTIQQKMCPCYVRNTLYNRGTLWYLSAGHLENSVILYMKYSFLPFFRIVELYENIRLENLLNF